MDSEPADGEATTLERRLQLLEDKEAILQVLYTYAHALDYDYADEWDDLWTDDAVLHWGSSDLRGEAIRDAFARHPHAPTTHWKHFMVEPRIVVDGDRATVDSYFARLTLEDAGPTLASFGRYRDVLRRCEDGRWRFHTRIAESETLDHSKT